MSILLFRNLDLIWSNLHKDGHEMAGFIQPLGLGPVARMPASAHACFENWFIAALPQAAFVKKWHAAFLAYWKDRKQSKGISGEPIFYPPPLSDFQMSDYLVSAGSFDLIRSPHIYLRRHNTSLSGGLDC